MKLSYTLLFASVWAAPALASVEQDVEVLIGQIEHSPCVFIRNGDQYNSQQAAEHIRNKWNYAKDDVTDIEMFISDVASKSWFSGKPYMVECAEQVMSSEVWLRQLWRQANKP
ncbi:membrane protein [Vibrio galatheae]|uniref:Membrane protein n=1 Tax=Vibrio galatheae TaxID=579748 RepID=A0A0F4NQC1_9VIBR|nr:DUF5329 family protein [Vibrio galatheae]KJY85023.1 membrane protein [Vibrio galatheae]